MGAYEGCRGSRAFFALGMGVKGCMLWIGLRDAWEHGVLDGGIGRRNVMLGYIIQEC